MSLDGPTVADEPVRARSSVGLLIERRSDVDKAPGPAAVAEPEDLADLTPSPAEHASRNGSDVVVWNGLTLTQPAEILLVAILREQEKQRKTFDDIADAIGKMSSGGIMGMFGGGK